MLVRACAVAVCGVIALTGMAFSAPVEAVGGSPPAQPTGLVAAATHDSVTLTWDDPGDDTITHYRVIRREPEVHAVGNFVTIENDTGSAGTAYLDGTVSPERRYVYRVIAVNGGGESKWSKYSSVTTPAPPGDSPPAGTEAADPTGADSADVPPPQAAAGFALHDDHAGAFGVWGRSDTLWLSAGVDDNPDGILAYTRPGGSRDPGQDFNSLRDQGNLDPRGIWSDGDTMFVVDGNDAKVYAYKMAGKGHDTDNDIELESTYRAAMGIWGDAHTIWVANDASGRFDKIFAYKRSDGSRDPAKDFDTLDGAGNASPRGIWSDGDTMFVVDYYAGRVFAYNMSDKQRDPSREIVLDSRNAHARGAWGDGDKLHVVDSDDARVYSYRVPGPATGELVIGGELRVGQTLTVDVSGIADGNGIPDDVVFSYQWLRSGGADAEIAGADGSAYIEIAGADGSAYIEIAGADGSAYTLAESDVGHGIRVRVGFTDSDGNEESLTGDAAGTVATEAGNFPAAGRPTVTGRLEVGQTLTVDVSGIADANGIGDDVVFSYQWLRSGDGADVEIGGADGSSYTLAESDVGHGVGVRVGFTDSDGFAESVTSDRTGAVKAANLPATGEPVIGGELRVGQTLTVDVSGIADGNGIGDDVVFSYRWLRSGDGVDAEIGGADGSVYTLAEPDVGYGIGVRVGFTDSAGHEEALTGDAAGTVATRAGNFPATGGPVIGGELRVGQTLTVDVSGIADGNGIGDDVVFSYRWLRSGSGADTEIGGADGSSYTLVASDEGHDFEVRVGFTDSDGFPETVAAVVKWNFPATGMPAIGGTPWVGGWLTADVSGIADGNGIGDDAVYSYQWLRSGGGTDTVITRNGSPRYSPGYADLGQTITVRVTFTDGDGHVERLTGDPTETVTVHSPIVDLESNGPRPWGIWANDETVWLSDHRRVEEGGRHRVGTAYHRRTGSPQPGKNLGAAERPGREAVRGVWSDGETVFVVDWQDQRVMAFNGSDGSRDSDRDIVLDRTMNNPAGIWGNDETIWVVNDGSFAYNRIYAYSRADGSRDPAKDFATLNGAGNYSPTGIWSDGETMFVVNWTDRKVYAYRMSDKSHHPERDIALFGDNANAAGAWGDGDTLYVVDEGRDVVHAYDLAPGAVQEPQPLDHTNLYRWLLQGNIEATGIWGDDSTVWVPNDGFVVSGSDLVTGEAVPFDFGEDRVWAYDHEIRNGPRATSSLNSLDAAGNNNPTGIWSDGETMFVVDREDKKIYAYRMGGCMVCGNSALEDENLALDDANAQAEGIWGNDETIWVANDGLGEGNRIFAYSRADGSRDPGRDFNTLDGAGNNTPTGLWSDGRTMFVTDREDQRVYAYSMSDRSHDPDKGIAWLRGMRRDDDLIWGPEGLWFDGHRLLVVADARGTSSAATALRGLAQVYAYILPGVSPPES